MRAPKKVSCDTLILGGGIAGLTAAYVLAKQGKKVVLVEKEPALGGAIFSYVFPSFTIEAYYHHFFPWDKDIQWMIQELGMRHSITWGEPLTAFYHQGKYHRLLKPMDLFSFSPLSILGKMEFARLMLKIKMIKDPGGYDTVSAYDFITLHGGKHVFQELFSFLLASKFGTDGHDISAAWFIERLQLRSNVGKKGEVLGYLGGGFYQLVSEIAQKISGFGGKIILGAHIDSIAHNHTTHTITSICFQEKERVEIFPKYVVSTIPPSVLGSLINFPEQYQEQLAKTQYQPAICLLAGLKKQITPYYWTNMLERECAFGAIVEQTNFIPKEQYEGIHLAYLASYVPQTSPLLTIPEHKIRDMYLNDLKRFFDVALEDVIWVKAGRLRTAGIIYTTGIKNALLPYETPISNLVMGGLFNSYPERTIDTSIRIGRTLAGKCHA